MVIRQGVVIGGIVTGMIAPGAVASAAEPPGADVQPVPAPAARPMTWSATALPPLGPIGYAGLYAGSSHGVLIAAGGTNFPDAPPWKQGKKAWYDPVRVLEPGATAWRDAGRLDRPRALGAAVTIDGRGVLCVGGGDEKTVFADVFMLSWDASTRQVARQDFPPLPKPVQASGAAMAGGRVYVVGGHGELAALAGDGPTAEVWSLDPSDPGSGWRVEPPLPAAGRFLPVCAGDAKNLFVFSGMTGVKGADGKPALHCLSDAWTLDVERRQWSRLRDLPRGNAAAPGPAPIVNGWVVLFGGGVDDTNFGKPMDQRPAFPPTLLAIRASDGAAQPVGEVRASVVAASVVPWQGGWVVISGEVKAGVRTPEVWLYRDAAGAAR